MIDGPLKDLYEFAYWTCLQLERYACNGVTVKWIQLTQNIVIFLQNLISRRVAFLVQSHV
jgi:hypothetical protein